MTRYRTLKGGAISVLALLAASIGHAQTTPNLTGIWVLEGPVDAVKTIDGKQPPLTAAAAKIYKATQQKRRAGDWSGDTVEACLPHGLPRLMTAPFPIEILQEAKQVTFIHEAQHMLRLVYLDEALPSADETDHNFMGNSVGAWREGALVVNSNGFNSKTTIDAAGMPHSEKLELREEFRLADGGRRLEDVITVTDPAVFTRPWSMKLSFKKQPGLRLAQYACTDQNREAHSRAN